MAIYARLENGTYAEVTGVYKADGTEITEIFQGDRLVYSATNEIYGTVPLYYDGLGYELIDYVISGNAVQDGTPSPDALVDATGCGAWDEAQQSYKLPLTVNGTEYPIYLGQVETTRRIKKLVLTGEEDIAIRSGNARWYIPIADMKIPAGMGAIEWYCSHYQAIANDAAWTSYDYMISWSTVDSGSSRGLRIRDINFLTGATLAGFKTYLAAQYSAGTPVTVWYVLAEPETAVVNEPLMRIGDYADTISFAQAGVTIPTENGENILDMTSPVKPSEVYIKGKGIKPTGYGHLTDVNGVNILDKDGRPIYVHGQ